MPLQESIAQDAHAEAQELDTHRKTMISQERDRLRQVRETLAPLLTALNVTSGVNTGITEDGAILYITTTFNDEPMWRMSVEATVDITDKDVRRHLAHRSGWISAPESEIVPKTDETAIMKVVAKFHALVATQFDEESYARVRKATAGLR